MTANNIEPSETTIIESVESTVIVEISPQTHALVEAEMAGETDEVKRETKALIEALRRRAQAEANSAGTLTRETYLNAVRQARRAIEGEKFIAGDRLEYTWVVFQDEAEKNWHLLMKEVAEFSIRLQKAAKAAWEAFNDPRSQS
ncbi:hypothetical protein A6770_26365 [Nostoc minutum NIES-26]|uniref:Uncharacterized protein n=1 Tax=Nostoc minutum NIES-26 TaxID=1844469 RepID=A0A367QQ62_9NOSO|nr:hypothetical protein [Dendronalium sp. ChiSLP03b]MDZ8208893.1 hypothetical protein [Dendronalium sp. ChiSLP03b]RCJ26235.1 hypothetical protein A6770_26365 [Nostoc minutum NIES-26]